MNMMLLIDDIDNWKNCATMSTKYYGGTSIWEQLCKATNNVAYERPKWNEYKTEIWSFEIILNAWEND